MPFFERPTRGERAILVHPATLQSAEDLDEPKALAEAAQAEVVAVITCRRKTPDPRFFIGRGKVEELAELVLVNQALSPSYRTANRRSVGRSDRAHPRHFRSEGSIA